MRDLRKSIELENKYSKGVLEGRNVCYADQDLDVLQWAVGEKTFDISARGFDSLLAVNDFAEQGNSE